MPPGPATNAVDGCLSIHAVYPPAAWTTPKIVFVRMKSHGYTGAQPALGSRTSLFGSIDAGVPNRARDDGLTFLDELWSEAPFANYRQFMTAVNRIAAAWQQAGRFSAAEREAVIAAARKAEREL